MLEWVAAATIAMLITLSLLLFAERLSKLVGERGLLAFERLMGLILTAIAVEMLLQGIQSFVRQL
jgi:small neutral amino acid transporter SnatA (MarC family)